MPFPTQFDGTIFLDDGHRRDDAQRWPLEPNDDDFAAFSSSSSDDGDDDSSNGEATTLGMSQAPQGTWRALQVYNLETGPAQTLAALRLPAPGGDLREWGGEVMQPRTQDAPVCRTNSGNLDGRYQPPLPRPCPSEPLESVSGSGIDTGDSVDDGALQPARVGQRKRHRGGAAKDRSHPESSSGGSSSSSGAGGAAAGHQPPTTRGAISDFSATLHVDDVVQMLESSEMFDGPRPKCIVSDPLASIGGMFKELKGVRRAKGSDTWSAKGGTKGGRTLAAADGRAVRQMYGKVGLKGSQLSVEAVKALAYHRWTVEGCDNQLFHIVSAGKKYRHGSGAPSQVVSGVQTHRLAPGSGEHSHTYLKFEDRRGQVQGGIYQGPYGAVLRSRAGDFAEWHRRHPDEAVFEEGDVVGIDEHGQLSRRTCDTIRYTCRAASHRLSCDSPLMSCCGCMCRCHTTD